MLNKYLTRTASLIDDPNGQRWSPTQLTAFINEARGRIAAKSQSVRILPPSTNSIASITVNTGGTYVSAPTVVITGPGTGATATATLTGTAVTSIAVGNAGTTLYDNTTTITFTGGGGTVAATATPVINCLNTVNNQEVYTFAAANAFARLSTGVDSILFVESVAVSWGSLKPVLDQWNWNDLQAYIRSYPIVSGQPCMWAQLAQGVIGSVYLRPVPTSALPMDWNCVCLPIDLVDDTTAEAIPYPWTDSVPYFAAYLAFMNSRRPEEAKNMYSIYNDMMIEARSVAEPSMIPSYYDF
jgi:hypothetical protein